ncbi:MAG: hypothetical protein AB7S98_13635 [Burkholderiaceae bacterium]
MRRWLLALMFIVLPLQASWAAAAAYCAHESGAAARHLGHHEHEGHLHDSGDAVRGTSDKVADKAPDKAPDSPERGDSGHCCSHCCGQFAALLPAWATPLVDAGPAPPAPGTPDQALAPSPARPERPQWVALA